MVTGWALRGCWKLALGGSVDQRLSCPAAAFISRQGSAPMALFTGCSEFASGHQVFSVRPLAIEELLVLAKDAEAFRFGVDCLRDGLVTHPDGTRQFPLGGV